MATTQRQRFVRTQLALMLTTVLFLSILGSLSLELFFIVSFIGFLVLTELTPPFRITQQWQERLKWIIAAGIILFVYVIIEQILPIIQSGVF